MNTTTLERFSPRYILQPAQGYLAAHEAASFGPNLRVYSGQALAKKTADNLLYPYSSGTITTPAAPAGTLNQSGGTLAVGTYYAKVTALFGSGVSAAGPESAAVTTTTGNQTIGWTWAAVAGATGYNFYRTPVNGGTGSEVLVTSVPANVTTFTDTGTIPAGTATPPNAAVAATDGTGTFVGLSIYPFSTNAAGLCIVSHSVTPGDVPYVFGNDRVTPEATMPIFYRGCFVPSDLVGLDAAAIASRAGYYLPDGNVVLP